MDTARHDKRGPVPSQERQLGGEKKSKEEESGGFAPWLGKRDRLIAVVSIIRNSKLQGITQTGNGASAHPAFRLLTTHGHHELWLVSWNRDAPRDIHIVQLSLSACLPAYPHRCSVLQLVSCCLPCCVIVPLRALASCSPSFVLCSVRSAFPLRRDSSLPRVIRMCATSPYAHCYPHKCSAWMGGRAVGNIRNPSCPSPELPRAHHREVQLSKSG